MFEGAQLWHSDDSHPWPQIGEGIDSSLAAGKADIFNTITHCHVRFRCDDPVPIIRI